MSANHTSALQIATRSAGEVAIVEVRGDLDLAHVSRLGVAINDILRNTPPAVVVDLRRADFVDTTGLAVLITAHTRAKRRCIAIKLACVETTLKLLRLTRLDREFDVYPTVKAALDSLA